MKLFLLNIGNTNIQTALYDGKSVTDIRSIPTSEFDIALIPGDIPIAAASVVPAVKDKLRKHNIFWISGEIKLNVDLSIVDTSTLGADRIANIAALAAFEELPAICMDCGTAVTYELVDSRKRFLGGAIAPGRLMLRKALNSYTAQLPLVPMGSQIQEQAGTDTPGNILMGCDPGAIGSAKEIIKLLKKQVAPSPCKLIATGGDAEFFINNISGIEYGGFDYTLKGIAKAWELNSNES